MTEESIVFTQDKESGCWTSTSPDGKKKAHVRRVWDDPLVLTVELEVYLDKLEGWFSAFYEVIDIKAIRMQYPEAGDAVIRKNFAQIVREALMQRGWLGESS